MLEIIPINSGQVPDRDLTRPADITVHNLGLDRTGTDRVEPVLDRTESNR